MKDPIYGAYDQDLADARARAGDTSPEAIGAYADRQVADVQALAASIEAQRRREAERAAAAAAAAAAREQAAAQTPSAMGMASQTPVAAHLAFNPDTKQVMVNGQALPHDIQAWHAAATAD